jgi:hypothetical protein
MARRGAPQLKVDDSRWGDAVGAADEGNATGDEARGRHVEASSDVDVMMYESMGEEEAGHGRAVQDA